MGASFLREEHCRVNSSASTQARSIGTEAKAIAAEWEAAGSWDRILVAVPQTEPLVRPAKVTIENGIECFLAERSECAAPNTPRKARYLWNALKVHSESRGYVFIEQWATMDVREFRTSWEVAPNTAAKYMEIVKSFFEFSVSNGWIPVSPAKSIRNVKYKSTEGAKERIPFTDDEISRMFDACRDQYGKTPIRWSRDTHHHPAANATANYKYKWTGQDLADFIAVSIYTGLRISDVARFTLTAFTKAASAMLGPPKQVARLVHGFPSGCRNVSITP